jgi:hypothetical protein
MPKNKTVAGTADDPTVRYVTVTLNDEKYKLAYDFDAIAKAESLTGTNLLQAFSLQGMTATQLRGLFFACLMRAQPKMTLADVSKLLTLPNMATITRAIVDTWTASMPDPDPNEQTLDESAPASE